MTIASHAPSTNDPPAQARWARYWEVLLILLVFFIVGGAPAPRVNEPHYLCRLKHFWDPTWAAGDLFLRRAVEIKNVWVPYGD